MLQTEEGKSGGDEHEPFRLLRRQHQNHDRRHQIFTVSADGAVHQGPNELAASGLPRSFTIDDSGGGGGDTTPPTTSITAPLAGATVSGTTTVTASASDNVGVTKVEFYLDGALQSTDTTSPYSWSWNTTTATNGSHSLTSKAYDAALNVGTSTAVNVTVSNGVPVNIGGWTLTQANATLIYTIPAGTTIASKGYVIIARNATKTAFQTFWGVTLGANVVFINSADTMPQINGSETYTLKNAAGTTIEGTTVAMDTSGGSDFQRATCGAIGTLSSWTKSGINLRQPRHRRSQRLQQGPVHQRVLRRPRHGQLRLRVHRAVQRQIAYVQERAMELELRRPRFRRRSFVLPFRLPTRARPPRSHSRCTKSSMITILLLLALRAPEATAMHEDVLLKARYIAVEGTDPEYAQGAIERNELRHHPMPHFEWLILVEAPADAAEWRAKLNDAVDPKHGSFVVECASAAEEERAVRSGKITMQG